MRGGEGRSDEKNGWTHRAAERGGKGGRGRRDETKTRRGLTPGRGEGEEEVDA